MKHSVPLQHQHTSTRHLRPALRPLAVATTLLALAAAPAQALDKTWRFIGGCTPASADWQGVLSGTNSQGLASCWGLNNTGLSGLSAPTAADNVFITGDGLGTTQTVNFAAASRPAFTGQAATLGVYGLNATSVAALDVQRHTLNVVNLNLGLSAPVALRGLVNQSGGAVNVLGTFALQAGDYNLGGGALNATVTQVTALSAPSRVAMTGGSASLGSLSMGALGAQNASFSQVAGSVSSGDIVLGTHAGSGLSSMLLTGDGMVPSAVWNAANQRLDVGSLGSGRLEIQTGAVMSVRNANVGTLPGSSGVVVVSGLGPTSTSTLNVGNLLRVGGTESGRVLVSTRGILNASAIELNSAPPQFGGALGYALEVEGTGSQANVTLDMRLGTVSPSALRVANTATFAARDVVVAASVSGRSNVILDNGAQFTARRDLTVAGLGTARVDVNSGSRLGSNTATVGDGANTAGIVRVAGAGSAWVNPGLLQLGQAGDGAVTLDAGARLESGQTRLGALPLSVGSITANGAGTTWAQSAGVLVVGELGSGRIEFSNGATVSTAGATLGLNPLTGNGSAVLRGAGTTWKSAGGIEVGYQGQGTLVISDGAQLTSMASQVASFTGSNATVNLSGNNSRWTAGSLLLGAGSSELNVDAGARLVVGAAMNVAPTLGVADLKVSGVGSLVQTGALLLGGTGTVTAAVAGGATLQSADGRLALGSGGSSSVDVQGSGSRWQMAGDLTVGGFGQARLMVADDALVQLGGTTRAGATGRIVLDGGTLRTGAVLLPDVNALDWRRGELHVTGANGFALDGQQRPELLRLFSNQTLRVDNTFTLTPFSVLLLNGGRVFAGTLQLNNAVLASQGATPVLDVGGIGLLSGNGQVAAPVVGGTGLANRIAPTGSMTLGLADRSNGFNFGGWLDVGTQQVVLLDSDWADLGNTTTLAGGGQLVTVNGARQGVGEQFRSNGAASVQGRFLNNGEVLVESGQLSFFDNVSGAGSFAGDVRFLAGFAPGNSTAAVSFGGGNLSFGPHSALTMEFDGVGFDQLLAINQLSFGGRLTLDFASGFAAAPGTRFQLLQFNSFSGQLDGSRITVTGFNPALLDTSRLGIDGSIAVVPEPGSWALMLGGLLAVVSLARRPHASAGPLREWASNAFKA